MFLLLNLNLDFCIIKLLLEEKGKNMKKNILMLYPSVMEIEQKSDMNSFWRSEWKRVKEEISDLEQLLAYYESGELKQIK